MCCLFSSPILLILCHAWADTCHMRAKHCHVTADVCHVCAIASHACVCLCKQICVATQSFFAPHNPSFPFTSGFPLLLLASLCVAPWQHQAPHRVPFCPKPALGCF